jgi:hypothetical protein
MSVENLNILYNILTVVLIFMEGRSSSRVRIVGEEWRMKEYINIQREVILFLLQMLGQLMVNLV